MRINDIAVYSRSVTRTVYYNFMAVFRNAIILQIIGRVLHRADEIFRRRAPETEPKEELRPIVELKSDG